jgi:hypothetical protein
MRGSNVDVGWPLDLQRLVQGVVQDDVLALL